MVARRRFQDWQEWLNEEGRKDRKDPSRAATLSFVRGGGGRVRKGVCDERDVIVVVVAAVAVGGAAEGWLLV
jgi:hypothetical protein